MGATLPAAADPVDEPTTAEEAKIAWLETADAAEAANEALLAAREAEQEAQSRAALAQVALVTSSLGANLAESDAVAASARYVEIKQQLSEFASASFRGAQLGQFAALLNAESSSDYLDEVASLDQVAGHTRTLMEAAFAAKDEADRAAATAEAARRDAAVAQATADAALTNAEKATKEVSERKATLDENVATYRALFTSLSAEERQAAMEAQQAEWERQAQEALATAADADDEPGEGAAEPKKAAKAEAAPSARAQIAVDAALSKVGASYVYGAAGPNVFDCSGLTSWAWKQAGVKIPRTSRGQAGLASVPLDRLQPGDLVTYYSPVHHVAMYIGNGQIVHASTEGKPVYITSVFKGGPYPTGHRVSY